MAQVNTMLRTTLLVAILLTTDLLIQTVRAQDASPGSASTEESAVLKAPAAAPDL